MRFYNFPFWHKEKNKYWADSSIPLGAYNNVMIDCHPINSISVSRECDFLLATSANGTIFLLSLKRFSEGAEVITQKTSLNHLFLNRLWLNSDSDALRIEGEIEEIK